MATDPVGPKRLRILRAIKARLEDVLETNGYYTDAGVHVHLGSLHVGASELEKALPALVLTVGRTETPAQGAQVHVKLPLVVQGLVLETMDDPLVQAELLIADVKRALFLPGSDLTFGGLLADFTPGEIEPVEREKGSAVMGLQVEALASWTEKRGEP